MKFSQQFLEGVSALHSVDLIRALENEYAINPVVYSLLLLADDGYISTKDYKQAVFQHKLQQKFLSHNID